MKYLVLEIQFQFSPLREGRLLDEKLVLEGCFISILAPARGATSIWDDGQDADVISILAPARGATGFPLYSLLHWQFQFSPLREGRLDIPSFTVYHLISILAPARGATRILLVLPSDGQQISILAPARGATRHAQDAGRGAHFNSRPCERGDAPSFCACRSCFKFQFSPLREGRRWLRGLRSHQLHFNSRPCERGDRNRKPKNRKPRISILAPARGATTTQVQA